jgi:hypothetical protein
VLVVLVRLVALCINRATLGQVCEAALRLVYVLFVYLSYLSLSFGLRDIEYGWSERANGLYAGTWGILGLLNVASLTLLEHLWHLPKFLLGQDCGSFCKLS